MRNTVRVFQAKAKEFFKEGNTKIPYVERAQALSKVDSKPCSESV